jgi:hypothetical protein
MLKSVVCFLERKYTFRCRITVFVTLMGVVNGYIGSVVVVVE